jgi:hypothetical protein
MTDDPTPPHQMTTTQIRLALDSARRERDEAVETLADLKRQRVMVSFLSDDASRGYLPPADVAKVRESVEAALCNCKWLTGGDERRLADALTILDRVKP